MSWIERAVERRLDDAAAAGELDVSERFAGKPIPGLDRRRPDGWWADRFVERERSRGRWQEAVADVARHRAAFWRAVDVNSLVELVGSANSFIADANAKLVDEHRIEPFDTADIMARWRRLHT